MMARFSRQQGTSSCRPRVMSEGFKLKFPNRSMPGSTMLAPVATVPSRPLYASIPARLRSCACLRSCSGGREGGRGEGPPAGRLAAFVLLLGDLGPLDACAFLGRSGSLGIADSVLLRVLAGCCWCCWSCCWPSFGCAEALTRHSMRLGACRHANTRASVSHAVSATTGV
jgi:hypothetical protein